MTLQQVEQLLVERLGCEHVVCEDISGGCGQSFDLVEVVTPKFEGQNRLKRHRLVRGAAPCSLLACAMWRVAFSRAHGGCGGFSGPVPQINEALKEELEVIHALKITKCYTPEEYRAR